MTVRRGAALCLIGALCCAGVAAADPAPMTSGPAAPAAAQQLRGLIERLTMELCVTPVVGEVFQTLVATQAFKPALGDAFTLQGGSASNDRLELVLQDARQQPHRITLALGNVRGLERVGSGHRFEFYLTVDEAREATATQALLDAAAILDAAMPDAAFAACASKEQSESDPMVPLASAGAQTLVLLAAVIYGLRVLGRS